MLFVQASGLRSGHGLRNCTGLDRTGCICQDFWDLGWIVYEGWSVGTDEVFVLGDEEYRVNFTGRMKYSDG